MGPGNYMASELSEGLSVCASSIWASVRDFCLRCFQLLILMFLFIQYLLSQSWGFCGVFFLVCFCFVVFFFCLFFNWSGAGGACNKIGSSRLCREVCCDSNSILGLWHPACGKCRLTRGLSYWISVCFCFCFLAWFCLQFPSQDLMYFGDF